MTLNDILQWSAIVIILIVVAVVLVRKALAMRDWSRSRNADCCNCSGCPLADNSRACHKQNTANRNLHDCHKTRK